MSHGHRWDPGELSPCPAGAVADAAAPSCGQGWAAAGLAAPREGTYPGVSSLRHKRSRTHLGRRVIPDRSAGQPSNVEVSVTEQPSLL